MNPKITKALMDIEDLKSECKTKVKEQCNIIGTIQEKCVHKFDKWTLSDYEGWRRCLECGFQEGKRSLY
jgi:hypothetical protein